MKQRLFQPLSAGLLLALGLILSTEASAQVLATSSFGGCGTSSAQGYVSTGGFQSTAERPSTSGTGDAYSSNIYPGLFPAVCIPVMTSIPVVHLVATSPGNYTLVAVPDLPGWEWSSSEDLKVWSIIPDSEANPVLLESFSPRQFFRYVQP